MFYFYTRPEQFINFATIKPALMFSICNKIRRSDWVRDLGANLFNICWMTFDVWHPYHCPCPLFKIPFKVINDPSFGMIQVLASSTNRVCHIKLILLYIYLLLYIKVNYTMGGRGRSKENFPSKIQFQD